MRIPTIQGVIERRILANFRVAPEVLAEVLPRPFRPQIIEGHGIAGICLIRLRGIRPKGFPSILGIDSENAAHRIAVEWDSDDGVRTGVFIPRRDTSSLLNALAGGRIFPGVHHRARFDVKEAVDHFRVDMRSVDGLTHVLVDGQTTSDLPPDSIFPSVKSVSDFFEAGSLGYSPGSNSPQTSNQHFDGLELRTSNWCVQPLSVSRIESSFFDDRSIFPADSIAFDNALLMQGIDHEWHSQETISSKCA